MSGQWDRSASRDFHLMPQVHPVSHSSPFGNDFSLSQVDFDSHHPHSDPHHPHHPHSSETSLASKTGTKVLKSNTKILDNPAGKAAKHIFTGIKVYHVGEKFVHNYQDAITDGHSPLQALTCETLHTAADVATTNSLQTVVTSAAAVGAIPLAVTAVQNPGISPLVPKVVESVVDTYEAAGQVGQTVGNVVQKGCYDAFNAADAW